MKKIIALMLALMLALGLVACAADGSDGESTPADSTESSAAPAESESKNLDRTGLPYRTPMSETVQYMIGKAWKSYDGNDAVWFDEYADELDNEAMRYYGVFGDDYIILFDHIGWDLEFDCSVDVAGENFLHKGLFEIYGYKDGRFYDLATLYENGEIELPEVMIIADIHAMFEQYIKTYS